MLYPLFLFIAAIEMLWEARVASRNSANLLRNGAVEIAPWILPVMVLLFALLFVGSFAEYLLLPKDLSLWWFGSFVFLFCLAKALKYWAVSSLGPYWTMKVLVIPGSQVITKGPYKWIRHPNYVAVLLEIVAIALAGKCWITFGVVFASFLVVLYYRIQFEEKALATHTDYNQRMMAKGRFL